MPTVIALDVSLSMARPATLPDTTEQYQLRHLAIHGIQAFLDHLTHSYKLEFVSLVAFSYLYQQLVKFTRDFQAIRAALDKMEVFSKTCVESALAGIRAMITDEWSSGPAQVILVTDGALGVGQGSLTHSVLRGEGHRGSGGHQGSEGRGAFPLPFPSPCTLHVVCVGDPSSPEVAAALPWYQRLIDLGGHGGERFTLDGPLSFKSVSDMFGRLTDKFYSPFHTHLHCGHFDTSVQLFPRPEPFVRQLDVGQETWVVSRLEILGFMDIKDIGSPPTHTRHLVLPHLKANKDEEEEGGNEGDAPQEDSNHDNGRSPSFTVLLHGSLKVEGMVAVLRVTDNWYGIIYSWADSKKKSNLMLGLFEPGQGSVPWLGPLDELTSCKVVTPDPYSDADKRSPFPVCPSDKRSYAQSTVVWIKPTGLQSDIQKVVRHAKKLPDKLMQFYKELNRTRRAALSFGFLDLLEALAVMLERECCLLPGTAHPNAAFQLEHAYTQLRDPHRALDYSHTIHPLHSNFAPGP